MTKVYKTGQGVCPYCESADSFVNSDTQLGDSRYCATTCLECGGQWDDVFEFDRRLDFDTSNEMPITKENE